MSKLENPEILVVDDDLEAAQAFADLLMAKIKIGAIAECDPKKVLQHVRQNEIKVVVLDQRMPQISGTDLYRDIRKENPYIKAVMLTGEADREEVAEAMGQLHYAAYLEKRDLDSLHKKVVLAYSKYEEAMELQKENRCHKRLWIFNPLKNRFFTQKMDILSIECVNDNLTFPNNWRTNFILDADEREQEDTYEFEDEIIVTAGSDIKMTSKFTGALSILPTFKSEIDAAITESYNLNRRLKKRATKKVKNTYRLQDHAETGKIVVKKIFESCPVYSQYHILLRKICRFCKSVQIMPMTVYKRLHKEATKVTIYYTDGTSDVIDTGFVSL
ncbi:response regulator [Xylanibacter brevis]|uniref:response regulator n=1 Tax=Xylanibacter brevis TaxID=83231 RepID=UPI0004858D02|nr:response regulator [Xylanibacter brevis]